MTKKLNPFRTLHVRDFDGKIEDLPYDEKCSIKRSSRVLKIFSGHGDLHKDGSKGTTFGACIHEGSEYYVVRFDEQRINKDNIINFSSTPNIPLDYLFVEVPGYQLLKIIDKP